MASLLRICLALVVFGSMLVQTTNSLRVAVLGSGIAGSSAARTLADRGAEVTVFEAGRGIGGRTSTRITRSDSRHQFDHGAQYIGSPKTDTFRDSLESWKSDGFVKEWSGTFATAIGSKVEPESEKKDRWVGFPRMNSICSNLLHHKNIRVKLQTRAEVSQKNEKGWNLKHGKTKEDLGTFDWLIASDRNSGAHHRTDLSSANVQEFTTGIRDIQSVKSLTAMVVFEKPLDLKIDGIQFTGKDAQYGSLGWVARDTSKPGRERKDGQECWVLQSHPDAAKELLKGKYKIGEIREMAREVLVGDFLNSLPHLAGSDNDGDFEIPSIATSMGHRWGAAFPIPSQEFTEMDCHLIASEQFVACGDYFGKLSGRIEGAYLSGRSAANEIIQLNEELLR
jgi:renalase